MRREVGDRDAVGLAVAGQEREGCKEEGGGAHGSKGICFVGIVCEWMRCTNVSLRLKPVLGWGLICG